MSKAKTAATRYDGGPFIVIAKKSMHRGGRQWTTGVHEFITKEQLEVLGDDEAIDKMLSTLALYPADFEVKTASAPPSSSQD